MRTIAVALTVVAGLTASSSNLHGQNSTKPSPYTGVSQPPPDDTITTAPADDPAPAAHLVVRPPASPSPVPTAPSPAVPPAGKFNPDYGIVGDPLPAGIPATKAAAVSNDLDADIVTFVPGRPGELAEGTNIHVVLDKEISTMETAAGSDFSGRVSADVLSAGSVVIPQGSQVLGKVVRVTQGRRFGSPATIRLRPDVVVLPDGSRYVVRAQVVDTSSKTRIDGEGTLKPASQVRKNAVQEGVGIGAGAVAGAIVGGAPGALVGSIVGAGIMTTHILVQHPASVIVPANATLTLSLTQPMAITPAQNN